MDLTKQTDTELKALAYDELTKVQVAQNNVNIINQELARRNEEPVVEKKDGNKEGK